MIADIPSFLVFTDSIGESLLELLGIAPCVTKSEIGEVAAFFLSIPPLAHKERRPGNLIFIGERLALGRCYVDHLEYDGLISQFFGKCGIYDFFCGTFYGHAGRAALLAVKINNLHAIVGYGSGVGRASAVATR